MTHATSEAADPSSTSAGLDASTSARRPEPRSALPPGAHQGPRMPDESTRPTVSSKSSEPRADRRPRRPDELARPTD